MTSAPQLRDHVRGAVREEVMRQAWNLFATQGFESTTVDQIAEAAGMSRRTFFRYFAGKDELVVERLLESGREVARTLGDRPADEPAWAALRAAFEPLVQLQETHADKSRALLVMLRDEPAVRTAVQVRRERWIELLAPLVAERLPRHRRRTPDPRPAAVVASALACWEAAQEAWTAHPGAHLPTLLDEAMAALAPLG